MIKTTKSGKIQCECPGCQRVATVQSIAPHVHFLDKRTFQCEAHFATARGLVFQSRSERGWTATPEMVTVAFDYVAHKSINEVWGHRVQEVK